MEKKNWFFMTAGKVLCQKKEFVPHFCDNDAFGTHIFFSLCSTRQFKAKKVVIEFITVFLFIHFLNKEVEDTIPPYMVKPFSNFKILFHIVKHIQRNTMP